MVAVDGVVPFTSATRSFTLSPGAACLVPPGFAWSRHAAGGVTVVQSWFQVFTPPAWTDPLRDGPWPQVVADVPTGYLEEALASWGPAWQPSDGETQARSSHLFLLWLTDLLSTYFNQEGEQAEAGVQGPEWLTDAFHELIPRMSEHHWTVAGLARCAGVNPTHLADTCRRYLGESPSAILRRERVAFAISLLRSGRAENVERASAQLGYATPRAFWRQCLAETGHPPSYWLQA